MKLVPCNKTYENTFTFNTAKKCGGETKLSIPKCLNDIGLIHIFARKEFLKLKLQEEAKE